MPKSAFTQHSTNRPMPGVSGRQVPGNARLPHQARIGGMSTRVPFQPGGSSRFREYHRQQVRDVKGRFAGGWGFAWQGLEAVDARLIEWNKDVHDNIKQAAEQLKDEMVDYMKANAPWTDQTGAARANIQGAVVWEDDEHLSILLGHGEQIYYGVWLEVMQNGRFAIILPTALRYAPQFLARIRTLT